MILLCWIPFFFLLLLLGLIDTANSCAPARDKYRTCSGIKISSPHITPIIIVLGVVVPVDDNDEEDSRTDIGIASIHGCPFSNILPIAEDCSVVDDDNNDDEEEEKEDDDDEDGWTHR